MEGYMDIYTKVVLTVIAIALSIIALREAGVPAFAQSSAPVRVVICGAEANPNVVSSVVLEYSRAIRVSVACSLDNDFRYSDFERRRGLSSCESGCGKRNISKVLNRDASKIHGRLVLRV